MSAAPDKRRERALPAATKSDDQPTNHDIAMTTLNANEETEPTLNASALMGVSTHSTIQATDLFGAPEAMGKRKREKEHCKGPVAKKRSASKKVAASKKVVAAKKGAVSKKQEGKKKRRDESDEGESGLESKVEDSEEASSSESSSDSEAEDSVDEPLIQALGVRCSTRKTMMDPKRPDKEDLSINPVVIGTLDQVSRSSELLSTQPSACQPSPSLMSKLLVPPALVPFETLPSLAPQPLVSPALVPSETLPSLASQPLVSPALISSEPSSSLASQPITTVLYSAPPMPAGIRSFQWNSSGIHRNSAGIPLE